MADDGVRAAARSVRRYLFELVGPESEHVDSQIADLLAEPDGVDSADAEPLRRLLDQREGTRAFLAAVLADAPEFRPPQVRPSNTRDTGGYGPLPGRIGALEAPKFRCPVDDDYDWWRLAQTDAVPVCPTHGCRLVPVRD